MCVVAVPLCTRASPRAAILPCFHFEISALEPFLPIGIDSAFAPRGKGTIAASPDRGSSLIDSSRRRDRDVIRNVQPAPEQGRKEGQSQKENDEHSRSRDRAEFGDSAILCGPENEEAGCGRESA